MNVPNCGKKRKGCDASASSAYDFVLVRLFRGAQLVNGIVLIDTESQAKSNPAHIIGQMEIEPTRSLEQCLGVISNRFDLANNSEGHEGCEPIATPKVFKLFKVTNEMKIVSKVGAIHVVQKRLCLEVTDISAIKLRVGLLLEFVQVSTDVLDEHVRGGNATTSTSYILLALSQSKARHKTTVLSKKISDPTWIIFNRSVQTKYYRGCQEWCC